MNARKISLSIGVLSLALAFSAFAGEKDKATETKKQEAKAKTEAAQPIELKNQTHCPVMGGVIDSAVFTDIQGQRVYHCCAGCSGKLVSDPDKFFEKAASQGIKFENIQTSCPVSGEALGHESLSFIYKGRTVNLCCEKCEKMFMKDPGTYLTKMTEQSNGSKVTEKKAEAKTTGHEGHGH